MYKVEFYKGDYLERQRKANDDKCVCYVEHHFNSSASSSANYVQEKWCRVLNCE